MKKIFTALLLFLAVATPQANAQQQPIVAQDFPSSSNLLVNAGFENGKYGWTASAGTFLVNTTAKLQGNYGASWDASAAAQTLTSNSITIPAALHGKNGVVYCSVKASTGTATHTITVDDGTNDLVTAQTVTSSTSTAPRTAVNFIFPTSGTVRLKITAATNEPTTYFDGCAIAEASNVLQVSQARFLGSLKWSTTSSCNWASTSTSFTNFSNDNDCDDNARTALGVVTDPTSGLRPSFGLPYQGPGRYELRAIGEISKANSSNDSCFFRFSDGTNTSQPGTVASNSAENRTPTFTSSITYTSAPASSTIDLQVKSDAGGSCTVNAASNGLEFEVYFFPSSTETGLRPELFNWRVDASITAATNLSLGTSDVSSYSVIAASDITLANNSGRGVLTAQVPCASGTAPSGTTCSAADENVGVSFSLPMAGDVLACATFTHVVVNSTGDGIRATFQLVETSTTATTIVQEGKGRSGSSNNTENISASFPHRVCGTFTFSSAGTKVIRLMYEQDATGTPPSNYVQADAEAAIGQRDVHFEVYPIGQAIPAPILVGSVTSNTSGSERVERATFTNGGSCAVASQSGSWITGVSDPGTGQCGMTITGFSATPACVCTQKDNISYVCNIASSSSSAIQVDIATGAGTLTDRPFNIVCMGPR